MVYVMLAEGFEEVEALAPVDMLRRAGVNVVTVGVTGEAVRGSHGVVVAADITAEQMDMTDAQMVVLPGGMPGTLNLEKSDYVQAALEYCYENGIHIAAICAAPSILGHRGYLRGRVAICFPGYENELNCRRVSDKPVVTDNGITTAKSAGYAVNFGCELVNVLLGPEAATAVSDAVYQP
ncbi:MAG: DJ-1/PfpI family protein [Clostridia bacterium]|nr:DJ-1/PfpI family protein [Clostridia bacterium]MBQ1554126.1 DJ-1/PfpI family protein [Clostridia bacterium]